MEQWNHVFEKKTGLFPQIANCRRGIRCYKAASGQLSFLQRNEIIVMLGYCDNNFIVQRSCGGIVRCPMMNPREMFEVTDPM